MTFQNQPHMQGDDNQGQMKRYVHQTLTIDHFGIHATITENGKVIISSGGVQVGEDIEYDEVTVPASLIFKLATLLKATRSIKFVNVTETVAAQGQGPQTSQTEEK